MIELVAVTSPPPQPVALPFMDRFAHSYIWQTPDVFMKIAGDRPIEPYFCLSPRLALMCNADLVDPLPVLESPASLLARLYEKDGDDFAKGLHGWFGIILYDFESRQMKAWTDHFGVRRIVYSETKEGVVIGSDLRSLSPFVQFSQRIDPVAILEYLQYSCIPAPRTIYKGCRRLEPGHRLVSRPAPVSHAYWDMTYPIDEGKTERQWAVTTEKAIRSAVSLCTRLQDDGSTLGCFLSGGTDSSSISGIVGQCTGKSARTFSIGFNDPRYNEMEYARIAARHFQTDHHEYFVTPADILDLIPKAVSAYDEPFGNSSIIPAYYCARLAAENGVTHLLAGDGGDELFGGNQRYADDRVFQRYETIPRWLRKGLIEPGIRLFPSQKRLPLVSRARNYVRRASIPVPDRWHSYEFLSCIPLSEVFSQDFLAGLEASDPLAPSRRHYAHAPAGDDLNRWLYLDLRITINDNDLRKVAPMCELSGVVPRYPLLDPALAEFSGTLPVHLKVRGTQLRYIFKRAVSGLLPTAIIKKTKHGFGLPYDVWLGEHASLKDFTFDILGSQSCIQRGYFRPNLLPSLWSDYQTVHRGFYGSVLWLLLMLELWHGAKEEVSINTSAG